MEQPPQASAENVELAVTEVTDSLGYGYDECETLAICEGTNDLLRLSSVQDLLRNLSAHTYMQVSSCNISSLVVFVIF